jgi:hypothetical protein
MTLTKQLADPFIDQGHWRGSLCWSIRFSRYFGRLRTILRLQLHIDW